MRGAGLLLAASTCALMAAGLNNGLARTPPMGYNSWNFWVSCSAVVARLSMIICLQFSLPPPACSLTPDSPTDPYPTPLRPRRRAK